MSMVDGIPDGRATGWHPTGAVAYQGYYQDGERHGSFTFWDEDGTWLRIEEYERGVLLWSSTDKKAVLTEAVASQASTPEEDLMLWWKEPGTPWPASFPVLSHMQQPGVVAQLSLQSIEDNGTTVTTQHIYLAAAHSLSRLGAPKANVYLATDLPRFMSGPLQGATTGRVTLEGGASYAVLSNLGLRLGLMLPIANDDFDGYLVATKSAQHRIRNLVATYPRSIGFRTSAAYTREVAFFTFRVDPGLDLAVDAFGDETLAMPDSAAVIATLGLGVGMGSEHIGVSAQFDSAVPLLDGGMPNDTLTAFSLSTQVYTSFVQPSVSVTLPVSGGDNGPVLMLGILVLTE
jgi:hypothetical protein